MINISQAEQNSLMDRFQLDQGTFMSRLADAEALGLTKAEFISELAVEHAEMLAGYDNACQYEMGWHAFD